MENLRAIRDECADNGPTGEIAYNTLRTAILRGVLPAGTRLKEKELSEAIEMSRTPIREALLRLEAEGLVSVRPRSGMVVTTLSKEDILDLFVPREVLEGAAARLCAQHISPAQLGVLEDTFNQMVDLLDSNPDEMNLANNRFHRQMAHASGNRPLINMLDHILDAIQLRRRHLVIRPKRRPMSLEEHRWILEAIRLRREQEAEERARRHVRNALEAYQRSLEDDF